MNVGAKRCHNWWRTRWRDILAIPALAAGGQPLRGVVNVHERSVIMRGRGVCKSWTRRGEDCRSSAELRASAIDGDAFAGICWMRSKMFVVPKRGLDWRHLVSC